MDALGPGVAANRRERADAGVAAVFDRRLSVWSRELPSHATGGHRDDQSPCSPIFSNVAPRKPALPRETRPRGRRRLQMIRCCRYRQDHKVPARRTPSTKLASTQFFRAPITPQAHRHRDSVTRSRQRSGAESLTGITLGSTRRAPPRLDTSAYFGHRHPSSR
jgi:hypothetical protein